MQVKALDGSMHEVSPSEIERVYKMLPSHTATAKAAEQIQVDEMLQDFQKRSMKYKEKAENNIKRIVQLDSLPTTQDDVKSALACVLRHGCPQRIADALYEAMEFQVSRFMEHLVDEYME